jgi:hypothetical protein
MQADPLQQLRDIHLPPDPGWWPPAPGWWLLAAATVLLLIWGVKQLASAWRARAPLRAARAQLGVLYDDFQQGHLTPTLYAHGANELIKRLTVRALNQPGMAQLSGNAWLQTLDELDQSRAFTRGPGMALGDGRFRREAAVDVPELHTRITHLLGRLEP